MKPIHYYLVTFFATLFFNTLLISTATADVYAYHGINGERILTDKRIHDKQFKLVKVYKTARKKVVKKMAKRPYKASSKRQRKILDNSYQSVIGLLTSKPAPSKFSAYRCADKKYIQRKKLTYQHAIKANAKRYGVDEALIHSVVKQESCFNEKALSRAGAIGLMQLMPATASYLKVKDPWNPEQNIQGGVKYLSQMLKRFKGNKKYALAAYNAGPGKVDKYGGIPPYKETQRYVKKIMADYSRLKNQKL